MTNIEQSDVDLTIEPQQVPVNIFEADEAIVLVAPMPGVMPDDIQVTLDGRTLRVQADMRTSAPKDYLVHEWHYGPFERTVEIPEGFAGDALASFGNGQLSVRIGRGDGGSGGRIPVNANS